MDHTALLRRIRFWLGLFIVGLVVSGITAFPLVTETRFLDELAGSDSGIGREFPALGEWVHRVATGVAETGDRFPFMAYGTDWLAFAHLVIAVAFIGPWRDPVRNLWVIDFGLIACTSVIPLALTAGGFRGIPWFWQIIDCSFGLIGAMPLVMARRLTRQLIASSGS